DLELSLRILRSDIGSRYKRTYINYRIKPLIGSALGIGYNRMLLNIASIVYLNTLQEMNEFKNVTKISKDPLLSV
ncbi:MAG: hypothetical protein ACP5RY_06875, partial [Thermoplasmata archaeon]